MKFIKINGTLDQGLFARVDDIDHELLDRFKWRYTKGNYAVRSSWVKGSPRRSVTLFMHKVILGIGKGTLVDHIDGNSLNNSRSNLRVASRRQNCANIRSSKNQKKGLYKGVIFHKGQYYVRCAIKHVGAFNDPVSAAHAYDRAAVINYGEFASGNFINMRDITDPHKAEDCLTCPG